MYSYIKGELVKITDDLIVVENNGIGYEIICPFALSSKLGHVGTDVCVWFSEPEQKDMFLLLITVSGIGPKVAHSICSQLTPDKFALAVMGSDVKALTGVKGLGKKGAERIVLELRDKLKALGKSAGAIEIDIGGEDGVASVPASSLASDAVEALMVLGYKQADAANAVSSVYEDGADLQTLIRMALKSLAR